MGLNNLLSQQYWSGCVLEHVIPFCVTVASFNPEVLRGMQVLVSLIACHMCTLYMYMYVLHATCVHCTCIYMY